MNLVGGKENAGTSLKSGSGWKENGNGDDLYGFSALPAGVYHMLDYGYIGYSTHFWSSNEVNSGEVATIQLAASDSDIAYLTGNKDDYYSVRCVEDE